MEFVRVAVYEPIPTWLDKLLYLEVDNTSKASFYLYQSKSRDLTGPETQSLRD
jgi:hypothetical protein